MLWITGFDDQVATKYSTFLMAFSNVSWLSKTRPKVDTLAEVCFSGHDIFPGKSPMKVENDQETKLFFQGHTGLKLYLSTLQYFN